jgi:topoisomerase-4 subunit A
MAKKVKDDPSYVEKISVEPMDSIMDSRSAMYAKEVIQDRAIPDLRDGLKPVQRRILYAMYENGNTFDKQPRKCAGIVGNVMGFYHPHGDSSIYETLVRMSQDWKMRQPLIQFQGNNGSIDDDPPAAYRYTEAKLNEFSVEEMLGDIEKDTVDMTLNFDDTLFEPIVLPTRFPNLFVNGASGIAFAIATEIPPHNLNEMCEAAIYRLNHPKCELNEILNIVKGPDFPTGGVIYNTSGLRDIYSTGRGKIELTSTVDIDTSDKNVNRLIIKDIPYGVVKISLAHAIDKIRKSREIDGVIDVIDETAGDYIKIVVDLKKEISPEIVLNYLKSKTQLKISYSANIVAIDQKTPKFLPIITYLDDFLEFQNSIIIRRAKFDLKKATDRLLIVNGLIKAISVVNEVVAIIKKSKDKEDSKKNLMAKFGFLEVQAEAIVMMRLYKLSNTDVTIYLDEKKQLEDEIKEYNEILGSPSKVKSIIISDLKSICKKYGTPRRTKIEDSVDNNKLVIDRRALIIKEDCYVSLTQDGYINRSSIKSHDASNNELPKMKDNDVLIMSCLCNTMDYIIAFTNKGNYLLIEVCNIIEGKYKDQGKHVNYLTNLPFDEYIIKSIVVKDINVKASICLVSKNGQIKKTQLNEFYTTRVSKPIVCLRLLKDDELADVAVLSGNSDLLIITEKGNITYFNENEISDTGLKTSGVKAISTLKNSIVKSLFAFRKNERSKILMVTNNRMYRIYDNSYAQLTQRLGKTQVAFKSFKSDIHNLIYAQKILNKGEPINLVCLLTDGTISKYQISEFNLTPVDKYCKANMDAIENGKQIAKVYINNIDIIDSNFVIDEKPVVKTAELSNSVESLNKKVEEIDSNDPNNKKEETYEQISIFDDMGD